MNNYISKKNYAIEALRFLFICIICLWHCNDVAPWLHHGYIAVEFYFMLSGYFIYQSYIRHPNIGVFDFTWKKVKRFFPPFFISLLLLVLLDRKQYFYLSTFNADSILEKYFRHIHELFFCQCMGLTDVVAINHPLWFLSVLIFGGALLYGLLRNYPIQSTSLLIPAICIFSFPFLLSNGNCKLQNQMNLFGLQTWMIRGIAEMGLGIMVGVFLQHKRDKLKLHSIYLSILSIISLLGMLLMTMALGNYDYLTLFLVPLIILGCVIEGTLLNRFLNYKLCEILGGLSIYMYFIHLFVASLFWIASGKLALSTIPNMILMPLYLIVVIISACILKSVSSKIKI